MVPGWTENSERGRGVANGSPVDKDILSRWRLEGSDGYARPYGGRVAARLHFLFATESTTQRLMRGRERASGLVDWLLEKDKLSESEATNFPRELADSVSVACHSPIQFRQDNLGDSTHIASGG